MSEVKDASFEDALARLERIVAEMESGELSLDESMKRFEEGMLLSSLCSKKLAETEKRIEILVKKTGAEAEWQAVTGNPTEPGREFPADSSEKSGGE